VNGGVFNRDRLAKVLALLASPVDGEALAAARSAVKMLAQVNLRPEDLIDGIPEAVEPISFEPIKPAGRDEWSCRPEPPPPPTPTFRDLGPAAARRVIADILAAGNVSPRDAGFLYEVSARLYGRPHEGISTGEVRRLNKLWRAISAAQ
jgi:hypothetical protein